MHGTSQPKRDIAFLALVPLFALLVASLNLGGRLIRFPGPLLLVLAVAFALVGLVEVVLTLRLKEARTRRVFFLLAGASAAAIPVCVILHNVVYGALIVWFGEGFWERHGGDEAVFFILAVVVCPALFLVGTVGGMVFLAKDFQDRRRRTAPTGELR